MIRALGLMFMIMVIFMFMFVGQGIYDQDIEYNRTTNIYNLTETVLNSSRFVDEIYPTTDNYTDMDYLPTLKVSRIEKVLHSFINFILTTSFEIAKFFVEFGFLNPTYDYGMFMTVFKWFLWATVITASFPLLIPLIALIYLTGSLIYKTIEKVYFIFKKRKNIKKMESEEWEGKKLIKKSHL